MRSKLRICLLPLVVSTLAACGGSGSDDIATCTEVGEYACRTGETEPLYTFQWALNYASSYFTDFPETASGGLDLNIEPLHRQGIKGQGVNVLVLDSGTDLANEDLAPNADPSMSWNYLTQTSNPFPVHLDPSNAPHGTVVAGIIGAAQNGKGVMGIAPLVNLGAANLLEGQQEENVYTQAYGGASWSSKAHVFNASYGGDDETLPYESDVGGGEQIAIRGLKNLRDGKGAVFLKAAGNSFDSNSCGGLPYYFDCTNPANDPEALEPNIVVVAALNAKGSASSYSSAGPVVWVTGLGGEYGSSGNYGESVGSDVDGPTIFSTDIRGCIEGYSRTNARTPFLRGQTVREGVPDNPECDYTYMNGTSAATPTISGVAALILSANPDLTWRDVRDILRLSARKVDADYIHNIPRGGDKRFGSLMNLATNQLMDQMGSAADIYDGATSFPVNLGWQTNAAGYEHSDWYGFGVPDAVRAVELAQEYARNPGMSRADDVQIPDFTPVLYWYQSEPDPDLENAPTRLGSFSYQRVTTLGTLKADALVVDQFQVRLSGDNVCLGSVGIAVKSPTGTVSVLKHPNDHFKADGQDEFEDYALGSYSFYGEPALGEWEIFSIASNPSVPGKVIEVVDGQRILRESEPCEITDEDGDPVEFGLYVEARVIAQ
ncbi:S8 family serine peptidase [Pusillimonas sp. MFBS29]|uniref:S8 family serine peptidase n=1 Tax=Pusillimonas sp. MFBS29 TaxID=2886690 RepID=UPI001D1066AB|nr:S8 family serine peptidase [Pusillimonas sp. MFBS29]MCC2595827.1 S8 family serine peptidase [Pusillimonas sp. MFBS29]